MGDLEEICKALDKGKTGCGNHCCRKDHYLCAKYVVNQYISKGISYKDKNRLLLLKSECRKGSFAESTSLLVSIISMAICALTLLLSIVEIILGNDNLGSSVLSYVILLILIIYCIMLIIPLNKSKPVRKWKPYILTAIEEIEKEIQ